jgi:hypothetical protein
LNLQRPNATNGFAREVFAMKTIAMFAMLAMCVFGLIGTNASVGGPMTIMMICLVAMLAVGIHEAKAHQRGPLGWLANILVAIVGGFITVTVFNLGIVETMLSGFHFEGSLASTGHPLKYLLLALMALVTVLGAWAPLLLVNRSRPVSAP